MCVPRPASTSKRFLLYWGACSAGAWLLPTGEVQVGTVSCCTRHDLRGEVVRVISRTWQQEPKHPEQGDGH